MLMLFILLKKNEIIHYNTLLIYICDIIDQQPHTMYKHAMVLILKDALLPFGDSSPRTREQVEDIAFICINVYSCLERNNEYDFFIRELIVCIGEFPSIQMLGQAFWETSTKYTDDELKLILELCAVMCMHPTSRNKTYMRLASVDSKLANAFRTNEMLELAKAIDNVQMVPAMTKNQRLIIAFLRAYVAKNSTEVSITTI
jgi:hypothetical protein